MNNKGEKIYYTVLVIAAMILMGIGFYLNNQLSPICFGIGTGLFTGTIVSLIWRKI